MAYQPRFFPQQPAPRADPGDQIVSGLEMFARARQAEQEQNERRAQLVRENTRSDAYLKLQQDQAARGVEADKADLLRNPEFRQIMVTQPDLAIEIARRKGLSITKEDIYGPEAPAAPAPPSAPPPAGNQGADVGRFGSTAAMDNEVVAPGPATADAARQAQLVRARLMPPPLDQSEPSPNAQRAETVRKARGYRLKMAPDGLSQNEDRPGAVLFDSVAERQRREAALAQQSEVMRAAFGGDEKFAAMAAALSRIPGLSEETIAKSIMAAQDHEREAIAKKTEKADDRAFTRERDKFQADEAMKRTRVSAAAAAKGRELNHPEGELDVLDLEGNVTGKARSEVEGKGTREAQGATVGVLGSLGRLKEHALKYGRTIDEDATVRNERANLVSDVTSYLTSLYNTGVLNKDEFTRYKGQLDTSIITGGEAAARGLDVIGEGLRARYEARARAVRVGAGRAPVRGPAAPAAAGGGARAEAERWLRDNPNDPRAGAVREKLSRMGGR